MKHLIFTDIDGTIYPDSKIIHPQTEKDIKKAQDKGLEVILCTGNAYMDNVEYLAKKFNIKYSITSNGASIKDIDQQQFIFESRIPKNDAQKILDFANKHEVAANFWDEDKVYYTKNISKETINTIKNFITEKGNIEESSLIKNDIFKIEFYSTKEKVDLIEEFIRKTGYEAARMGSTHLEVTRQGVSKGAALKWLTNYLDGDLTCTMAIGDSANDVSMFKVANFTYAMANAPKDIKQFVKYHTAAVEQNGLGLAIIDYMYRNKIDK